MWTNPYYAKVMAERGETVDNLEIVENFFIPTKSDLDKITESIKDCKTIVDIGSGYGYLTDKLAGAMPDKSFLGIDTMYWDKGFVMPEARENLRYKFTGIEAMACERFNDDIKHYDCVLCCWMPEGSDWRELFSKIADKVVILILSRYFATATPETYVGMKEWGYKLSDSRASGESVIQIWKKNSTSKVGVESH